MKNDKDIQLIEDYIDGLLKDKDLEAFQKRLETDDAFAREYKLRKKLARLWTDADNYLQTKEQVGEIMQQEKRSVFYKYRKSYYIFAVASSIALLIGIYWLFVRPDSKQIHKNQMAEVVDTVLLQQDQPEKLAKIRYRIQLITPVDEQLFTKKDTLVFHWAAPADTVKISFGILDQTTRQIIFHTGVLLSDTQYTLYPGMLPPGKYAWYLQDTLNMNYFTIK